MKVEEFKNKTSTFNSIQVLLSLWTVIALIILISLVASGLLSKPEVFIKGYESYAGHLNWYIQNWHAAEQTPWIISLPMWSYRIVMMAWSVWLAFNLLAWLKWMWKSYSQDTWWMHPEVKKEETNQDIFDESPTEIKE